MAHIVTDPSPTPGYSNQIRWVQELDLLKVSLYGLYHGSKKSPAGPTFHGPRKSPEYLIARSQLRGLLVRSHLMFDGMVNHHYTPEI